MRKLFALVGKSSTGKDTLIKYLSEDLELPIAISFTTRPKRKGETEGIEYRFINENDFLKMKSKKLIAEYTGYKVASNDIWYYGLTKEELEQDEYVLVIVNPEGLKRLKQTYKDKVVGLHIKADPKTRIVRYLNRDNVDEKVAEECCRRFLADQKDFENLTVDYEIMNNGELIETLNKLKTIIRNERSKDLISRVNEEFKYNPTKFLGGNND
ncbi:guanylate kinase [Terrisporobacter sp.]|uniref:guanylate kinase n=1 Tax=Terrisporobacter sp. TaxID=1965305 RepID=UPI003994848D